MTDRYWDWSLDWMDLANSSIWDSVDGFGGNGDLTGPETVGEGRCVTDGPFAGLRPILYNHTYIKHCISRGFRDGETPGRLPGESYSPESIGAILRKPAYKELVKDVEFYLHNSLHQSINGDFKALTAANGNTFTPHSPLFLLSHRVNCCADPLFFVHHAQLDHVWWRWQRENPRVRLNEYRGKHMFNSTGEATVDDVLMYGGFAEDIPVSKIMDTEGGFLCYTY
jgi:tyrosinase